jgi:hypothetical protein
MCHIHRLFGVAFLLIAAPIGKAQHSPHYLLLQALQPGDSLVVQYAERYTRTQRTFRFELDISTQSIHVSANFGTERKELYLSDSQLIALDAGIAYYRVTPYPGYRCWEVINMRWYRRNRPPHEERHDSCGALLGNGDEHKGMSFSYLNILMRMLGTPVTEGGT